MIKLTRSMRTNVYHVSNARVRWSGVTRQGCTLVSQCQRTAVADQSMCSRSGCSDQQFRHRSPAVRVDVVTTRSPSPLPGARRTSATGSCWRNSTQTTCCRCLLTRDARDPVTTSTHTPGNTKTRYNYELFNIISMCSHESSTSCLWPTSRRMSGTDERRSR